MVGLPMREYALVVWSPSLVYEWVRGGDNLLAEIGTDGEGITRHWKTFTDKFNTREETMHDHGVSA